MQRVTMTEVYEEIGRWAPWDTAEEWDNVGVLVQGPDAVSYTHLDVYKRQ